MIKLEMQFHDGSTMYLGEAPNLRTAEAMIKSLDTQWDEAWTWENPPSQEEMDMRQENLPPVLQKWEGCDVVGTDTSNGKEYYYEEGTTEETDGVWIQV